MKKSTLPRLHVELSNPHLIPEFCQTPKPLVGAKKLIKGKNSLRFILLLCLGIFSSIKNFGNNITIVTATNWSAITSGSGPGGQPSSSDIITVSSGKTLTVDVPAGVCASIQLGSTTTNGTLKFNAGDAVTVSGIVTLGGTTGIGTITMTAGGTLTTSGFALAGSGTNVFTPGTGTVVLAANNTLPATIFTAFNNLTIAAGTTTTLAVAIHLLSTGTLTLQTGATLNMGTFKIGTDPNPLIQLNMTGATLSGSTGALVVGTSTVTTNPSSISSVISCPITTSTVVAACTLTYDVGQSLTLPANNYDLNDSGKIGVAAGTTLGIIINGPGGLELGGTIANTYNGGTTLNPGSHLYFGPYSTNGDPAASPKPLGTVASTVTINGGTIDNINGAEIDFTTAYPMVWAGDFTWIGSSALSFEGNVTLSPNGTNNATPNTITVSMGSATAKEKGLYVTDLAGATFQGSTGNLNSYSLAVLENYASAGTGLLFGRLAKGASVVNLNNLTIGTGAKVTASLVAGGSPMNLAGNFTNNGTYIAEAGTLNLTGNFINNGIYTASTGTVNFAGTLVPQTLGGSTVTAFNDLTIDNPAGVSLTGGNEKISDTLNLTSGQLLLLGNNLTMESGAAILGASSNSYIATTPSLGGLLTETYSNAGTYLFPVGDNAASTDYTPLSLVFTAGVSGGTISVIAGDSVYANNNSKKNYLSRYWTITKSISFNSYICASATGTYLSGVDDDIWGTVANINNAIWAAGAWTTYGTVSTSPYNVVISGASINPFGTISGIDNSLPSITGFTQSCSSVTVDVTGRETPFTYKWNPGGLTTKTITPTVANYTCTVTDANKFKTTATVTVAALTLMSDSLSVTNVSCYGASNGSASATVSGGRTPYTYSWSNGTTTASTGAILGAGNYTVTVQDNCGQTQTANVIITQPNSIGNSAGVIANVTCYGGNTGSASANPSGGTLPYTYSWSNGQVTDTASGLAAGTYSVTITDACGEDISTASVTITQPNSIGNSAGVIANVTCYGGSTGSASANPSGGTLPYTYLWSNGQVTDTASGLATGAYSVTITDACGEDISTASVTITQPNSIGNSASVIANVSCYGGNTGSASANPSGGSLPYTYLWSNGEVTDTVSGLAAGTYSVTITDACGEDISTASVTITQPNSIGNSASVIANVTCYGGNTGSASANPSGGTLPYTYLWSNGEVTDTASGLTAGTYSVTITDACGEDISTASVTITQPNSIGNAAGVIANVTCYGGNTGSASANPSGGTLPYTYLWSNGEVTDTASGLAAGTYSVTITDACGEDISTASVTITQPNALGDSVSVTNVSCNGGNNATATANVSGGTTPYTYLWSDSDAQTTNAAVGLSAGTYTVSVTDNNGCTISTVVIITEPTTLTTSTSVVGNVLCNGGNTGSATANVSGGTSPYTYAWSNGVTTAIASNLAAGSYSLIVTDANGCSSSISTVNITQPSALKDSIVSTNELCSGGNTGNATVSVSGGTLPYTYSWSDGLTTATASNLVTGTYSVTVIDANGCSINASAIVNQPGAIIIVPSSIVATCTNNNGSASVTVSGGASPYTYSWSNGASTSGISNLSAGSYSVTVIDNNGCSKNSVINVGQGLGITAVTSFKEATCTDKNGSASVTASGGTAPYKYVWSTSPVQTTATVNGLGAGTYTCVITDKNGCSFTATVNVPSTAETVRVASVTNDLCGDGNTGSINVSVSGGTAPYIYIWNPFVGGTSTVNNLFAGTYTVTVIDRKGCVVTVQAIVTAPPVLRDSIVSSAVKDVSCNGDNNGSATIGVRGGVPPYTYIWTPNISNGPTASNLSAGVYRVTVEDANGCSERHRFIRIKQPDLLKDTVVDFLLKDVSCNGGNNGSATISVRGGTAPYTYVWSPNVSSGVMANNLSAGTYTITVIDINGCSAITKTTIKQPALLRDSIIASSIQNVSCNANNGSATVGVKGGTAPYFYKWSNGAITATIRNLTVGNYTATVTDRNGCSAIATVSITQSAPLISSIVSSNNDLCNGSKTGSATVSVSGGISPYTYQWIPGGETTATASNLAPGNYVVIVRDQNNCTTQSAVTITQPAKIRDSIVSQVNISCNGYNTGNIVVGVKGGIAPYTYVWSPNVSTSKTAVNLSAGNYSITITDANGCEGPYLVTEITEPSMLEASITKTTCTSINTGSATAAATGGKGPYVYSWSPSGESSATATKLTAGTYTVTVTDKNKCEAKATVVIYTCNELPLGIYSTKDVENAVTVFPNPTVGNFTIEGVTQGQVIELYDYTGQELNRVTVENNTTMHFDLSSRANGIYLIRIENADGTLATERKMIKTQ